MHLFIIKDMWLLLLHVFLSRAKKYSEMCRALNLDSFEVSYAEVCCVGNLAIVLEQRRVYQVCYVLTDK